MQIAKGQIKQKYRKLDKPVGDVYDFNFQINIFFHLNIRFYIHLFKNSKILSIFCFCNF